MPSEPSSISQPKIDPALALFRDWQRHKLELANLTLTLADLKQWLNWWLMHDARLVNRDCSLMLDAIDSQCTQMQDPSHFMKLVLNALRKGDALDLETLAAEATSAPADDKPAAMDALATLKSHQAIRNFIEQQRREDRTLAGLNSAQLHQLVRAWIGDTPSLLLTAVEDQAPASHDLHHYFCGVLQSLLDGQAVDLDSLASTAPPLVFSARADTPGSEAVPAGSSPLPPTMQQNLPQRLADALLGADLSPLKVIWLEIMRFHADTVIAAAGRYLRRPQERAQLTARADPAMLLAMLKVISPTVGGRLAPLVLHAGPCNAVLPAPLPAPAFAQRVLNFAFEQAMEGGEDDWLAGVMLDLGVDKAWHRDVAHAWRAILPPSPALDSALFGDTCLAVSGESMLAVLLMRSSPLDKAERQVADLLLERLLAEPGGAPGGALESALCQPAAIARLTSLTSGPMLAQLLLRLQPALAAQLPAALNAMASAVAVVNVPAMQSSSLWSTIYQCAFVTADPVSPAEFIRTLVQRGSGRTDLPLPPPTTGATLASTLQSLLQPMNQQKPQAQQAQQAQDDQAWSGESDIRNAGMVIFATYMQRLFSILELTKDGQFVDDQARQRAVHLLQYAVSGESSTPEYQLVLNKLFCGVHGGTPIARGIDITQKEKDVIEQMLNGVIAHWSALGKTSIGGLRQTFLLREGHLYFEEESWRLRIPQATFDMLLDRLPWSFAMIKFPWMEHPLHVTWR